ncbi:MULTISPECIES: rhodanese-like domain-containing protein [Thioalkalivibrio]|uniref:Rhodanese n=1 Tax=Thioalkalivibrio halophilus TaxID=252474 RepID=A0A1V2ZYR9_9GAMM|nr:MULTISPECIES: rhodanese-like domain-containing protein [Thioalkalivibrio]OOC10226.1 rhodanese [Thioalkalivibrio halophilus]PYG01350.1 rhodanese-related sulfurtransferase [Thioalkalivibrio sp. ALE21]
MSFRHFAVRSGVFALAAGLLATPVIVSAQLAEFPGRHLYERFGVEAIELFDLRGQFSGSTLVDVRPRAEFDVMRMRDAHHVNLHAPDFDERVRDLEAREGSPLVFYCNGRDSHRAYRAAARASDAGLDAVLAYDAGMNDWARSYPRFSRLFGEAVEDDDLIPDASFAARLLDGETFARRAQEDDSLLLDISGAGDEDDIALFGGRERVMPVNEPAALDDALRAAAADGDTLLIFDQHGQQVRWLQYRLRELGIEDERYYFLEGGMEAFYDEVMG